MADEATPAEGTTSVHPLQAMFDAVAQQDDTREEPIYREMALVAYEELERGFEAMEEELDPDLVRQNTVEIMTVLAALSFNLGMEEAAEARNINAIDIPVPASLLAQVAAAAVQGLAQPGSTVDVVLTLGGIEDEPGEQA